MSEQQQLDTWAIVEQMGHNKYAGKVSEQTFGGASMLRLDVPEIPERKRQSMRYSNVNGRNVLQPYEEVIPARAAFTKFIGISSIFALTPCTEEVARAAAESFRVEPVTCVEIPSVRAIAAPDDDGGDDDASAF